MSPLGRVLFEIKLYRSLEGLNLEDKLRCYETTLRRLRTVFSAYGRSRSTLFGDYEHDFSSENVEIRFSYLTPGAFIKDGSLHLTIQDKTLAAQAYRERRKFVGGQDVGHVESMGQSVGPLTSGSSLFRSFCGFSLGERLDSRIPVHESTFSGSGQDAQQGRGFLKAGIKEGDCWNGLRIIEVSASKAERLIFEISLYRSLEEFDEEGKKRCYESTLKSIRDYFKVKDRSKQTFLGDYEHVFSIGTLEVEFRYSTPGAFFKDGSLHLRIKDVMLEARAYN